MKITEAIQEALQIPVDDNKVLYDYYLKELSGVLEAKIALEQLERDIRGKLTKYGPQSQMTDNNPKDTDKKNIVNGYPYAGSWVDKLEFVLTHHESLTGKEAANVVETFQPELKGKTASSVYPTLSDNSKEGKKFVKFLDEKLKVNKFALRNKVNNKHEEAA